MKFQADIEGMKRMVEVRRNGSKLSAVVDDREYDLEVSEPEPSVFLFKHNGQVTELFVSPRTNSDSPIQVQTASRSFEIKLIDPKRLRGTAGSGEHGDGVAEIRTAMPGKVVRILVEKGAAIEKGDGVLVVEAMKMQNELKSPKAGTVKNINVEEGSTVAAGDVLAVIE